MRFDHKKTPHLVPTILLATEKFEEQDEFNVGKLLSVTTRVPQNSILKSVNTEKQTASC